MRKRSHRQLLVSSWVSKRRFWPCSASILVFFSTSRRIREDWSLDESVFWAILRVPSQLSMLIKRLPFWYHLFFLCLGVLVCESVCACCVLKHTLNVWNVPSSSFRYTAFFWWVWFNSLTSCKDDVYRLSFSAIMLNTDSHNPNNIRKMSKQEYVQFLADNWS